jgi:hypothetical protein
VAHTITVPIKKRFSGRERLLQDVVFYVLGRKGYVQLT